MLGFAELTPTYGLIKYLTGSHGPPWESISRVLLAPVCITTLERGNESNVGVRGAHPNLRPYQIFNGFPRSSVGIHIEGTSGTGMRYHAGAW